MCVLILRLHARQHHMALEIEQCCSSQKFSLKCCSMSAERGRWKLPSSLLLTSVRHLYTVYGIPLDFASLLPTADTAIKVQENSFVVERYKTKSLFWQFISRNMLMGVTFPQRRHHTWKYRYTCNEHLNTASKSISVDYTVIILKIRSSGAAKV